MEKKKGDKYNSNVNKENAKVKKTPISFHFHPYNFEAKAHVLEKQEDGKNRRILRGISSGLQVDQDGEKMTEAAIKSFMSQAKSGDILLYAGNHGSDFTDDIGILTDAKILENGDWWTQYRLYDKSDNVGVVKLEKADTLWKQLNGLPPYKSAKQKGFSIEGKIPEEGGIIATNEHGGRVINEVELDGVWVVNRPSYEDGIVNAVAKALGHRNPHKVRKDIKTRLSEELKTQEEKGNFYDEKWKLQEALEEEVRTIMAGDSDKESELNILFDEYKILMIELITKYPKAFEESELVTMKTEVKPDKTLPISKEQEKEKLMKLLNSKLTQFDKVLRR